MKSIICSLFLFFFQFSYCQDANRSKILSFGVGKPFFSDMVIDQRNVSFTLRFQNRFSKAFGYDVFYNYAQSNNYPSFRDDPVKVDAFLLSQRNWDIVWNSLWSDVYAHYIGTKIHFALANNEKWYITANFAVGIHTAKSSLHVLEEWSYDIDSGEIWNYENSYLHDVTLNWFTAPGFSVSRTIPNDIVLGLDFEFISVSDRSGNEVTSVIANNMNLVLFIGKILK